MKILFGSTVFPHPAEPTRGTYNLALCRALAELRTGDEAHEVSVVAPRMWQTAMKKRGGSPLNTASLRGVEYPTFYYVPGYRRRELASWLDWSSRSAVRKQTKDWRPDIVLSYWADPDGAAALQWARRFNAKFAVIVGGTDVLMLPQRPALKGLIESTLEQADLVATVSDQLSRAVHDLCPQIDHVQCLRQGIDESKLHDGNQTAARVNLGLQLDKPIFLWVGRLDPVKNLGLLLESFSRVCQTIDAQLVVVGDGPKMANLQSQVVDRGLSGSVRIVGAVAPEALGEWYRAADATVLSSHSEGLPNVLRESLACGRPFASVDVGGISEIGDDTCRILSPANDAASLAQSMLNVLDPVLREAAAAYPVRTWRDAAIDYERAFRKLLAPTGGQGHRRSDREVLV